MEFVVEGIVRNGNDDVLHRNGCVEHTKDV